MKRLYILVLLACCTCFLQAQPYANEWIPFSTSYSIQQYFKISVWREGIYRITYNDLQGANVPLASINPRKLQLFREGKEQFIYISNDTATTWNNTMYIEFYGRRNDGQFDARMYDTDTSQVNKN